ncbi:MAG: hypothetical protein ACREB6_04270 [Rhodospirillales bacterium]
MTLLALGACAMSDVAYGVDPKNIPPLGSSIRLASLELYERDMRTIKPVAVDDRRILELFRSKLVASFRDGGITAGPDDAPFRMDIKVQYEPGAYYVLLVLPKILRAEVEVYDRTGTFLFQTSRVRYMGEIWPDDDLFAEVAKALAAKIIEVFNKGRERARHAPAFPRPPA